MKTAYKLTIVSSLLLAAGCSSWHERHAKYEENNQQYSSFNGTGAGITSNGSSFQPNATQSTNGTVTEAPPHAQTFRQTGGDNGVVQQVQQQLNQDPALASLVPNLQISFQNGTVVLAGSVPTEQAKTKIETIVKSSTGVANVNNQLQVSQSQLNPPSATENKQAVGGTSEQSTSSQSTGTQSSQPLAPQSSNEQSVTNTIIQPSSSATQQPLDQSSAGQFNTNQLGQDESLSPTSAQQTTNRIYGTNQSTIGTSGSLGGAASGTFNVKVQAMTDADRTLGQQIVQELRTDTTLATILPRIKLGVDNGKITLSGTVKSEDQKKTIESAVQHVTGVANVENHLRVSTGNSADGTTQDKQLESK